MLLDEGLLGSIELVLGGCKVFFEEVGLHGGEEEFVVGRFCGHRRDCYENISKKEGISFTEQYIRPNHLMPYFS